MDLLARNEIPKLTAMNLHNGTLYKWNRACYGVGGGKAHLRIENRYVPAGPTPHDEMANVALWIGVMEAMPEECCGKWEEHFLFQDIRCNFLKAARNGLSNEMRWFGKWLEASEIIIKKLLPMARQGLEKIGIPASESDGYLNSIRERVERKRTGSNWAIESFRSLRQRNSVDESLLLVTQYMKEHGLADRPGHLWELPNRSTLIDIPNRYHRVDSVMVTNLVTVREDDIVEFAATLMDWNDFHHLPVENEDGKLVGIVSTRDIEKRRIDSGKNKLVSDYMTSDIITVTPETSMEVAEQLMLANDFGSLPVVHDGHAIGIVTVNDIRRLRQ
jgi:CBS domain-containing protein